jgi:uncharacterized protein (DUF305 family)
VNKLTSEVRSQGSEISATAFIAVGVLLCLLSAPVYAQQGNPNAPVIVQPGAPGQPTKTLPASTTGVLPAASPKDVEFMQGMIMHHAQAVEMTALIDSRTENKELRLLGARISHSQAEEIKFMERWLAARGKPTTMPMPGMDMPGMDMSKHEMLMPGMLTHEQMNQLRNTKGKEFDELFLRGMIQHHAGALIMVRDLFETAGAGQDAVLSTFATDIDSGQRAEIRIMQNMLGEKPVALNIASEHPTIVAGSDVSIKVSLTNTAHHDWPEGVMYEDGIYLDSTFRFEVRDEHGNLVPKRHYPYEELRGGKVIFRTLRAGETFTQSQAVSARYDMRKPGKYTIQVSREDVKSNIVTVTVTPNGKDRAP